MDTREKILGTATRLFSTQGYANTSLSQVAKEAQVSKALIFWHFENKEKLFRTALHGILVQGFMGHAAPETSEPLLQHLKTSLVDALVR